LHFITITVAATNLHKPWILNRNGTMNQSMQQKKPQRLRHCGF